MNWKLITLLAAAATGYILYRRVRAQQYKKDVQDFKKDWYEENAPFGKQLGYPDCCIKAFCDEAPQVLRHKKITEDDKIRYRAAFINENYTGFIPCAFHAKQIAAGQITLQSLITNRNPEYPPFPETP